MILALLGGAILAITAYTDGTGFAGYIVGGILVLIGVCTMSYHEEDVNARTNRRRYWAYGEEPDWKRNRRR